ncbi:hypothetical protein THRCLA_08635 [Thraustotheca clavata]|uniref:acid phosphatase n=1 Tax=Thraustotheca clavata TaxID=74557 RepID=A0A1V9Z420_9STRA|nr:hypothetical protein THRCLA_08635 [Thraustotheca clavata]
MSMAGSSAYVLLFVCTSNTCRSPMAEAMAKQWFEQNSLPGITFEIGSIALSDEYEPPNSPASQHGITVMEKRGICLKNHRSRLITKEIINQADFVYCVTARHAAKLHQMFPTIRAKVEVFPQDIHDPWHQDEIAYEICADQIYQALSIILPKLLQHLRKLIRKQQFFTQNFFTQFEAWLNHYGTKGLEQLGTTQNEKWIQRVIDSLVALGNVDGLKSMFDQTSLRTCHILALCCAAATKRHQALEFLADQCDDPIMKLGPQFIELFDEDGCIANRESIINLITSGVQTNSMPLSTKDLVITYLTKA